MDSELLASLFPRVVELTDLAITNSTSALESEQKQAKLAQKVRFLPPSLVQLLIPLAQSLQLRTAFESLTAQAIALPAGDLTLDDQSWLIDQLAQELAKRRSVPIVVPHTVPSLTFVRLRQELAQLNELIPTSTVAQNAQDQDAKMAD